MGNTLSDAQGRSFSHTNAGQLSQVIVHGKAVGRYTYNGLHQRTQKITPRDMIVYHHDLHGNLILDTHADGTPSQTTISPSNLAKSDKLLDVPLTDEKNINRID